MARYEELCEVPSKRLFQTVVAQLWLTPTFPSTTKLPNDFEIKVLVERLPFGGYFGICDLSLHYIVDGLSISGRYMWGATA